MIRFDVFLKSTETNDAKINEPEPSLDNFLVTSSQSQSSEFQLSPLTIGHPPNFSIISTKGAIPEIWDIQNTIPASSSQNNGWQLPF